MNTGKNLIIFSVDRHDVPFSVLEAARRDAISTLDAMKATYTIAESAYKGNPEQSYIVQVPTPYVSAHAYDVMGAVVSLVRRHDQESYLYIDVNGYVTLENISKGESIPLSPLKEVTEEYAKDVGSYTKLNGVYYSTL